MGMTNTDASEHRGFVGRALASVLNYYWSYPSLSRPYERSMWVYRAAGRSEAPGTDFSQHLERGDILKKKTLLYIYIYNYIYNDFFLMWDESNGFVQLYLCVYIGWFLLDQNMWECTLSLTVVPHGPCALRMPPNGAPRRVSPSEGVKHAAGARLWQKSTLTYM